jgi:putative membrane-bound dehydrogenase-like protein
MRVRPFRPILIAVLTLIAASPAALFADDEEGFRPIFDGQSLDGWRPHGDDAGYWRVEDGAIVGESTEDHQLGHNTFLVWDQGQVDDFELRLQFRITGSNDANSGIQFRGTQREDGHVIGYQADIDRAGNWIGCLYDEAQRGALATRGQVVSVNEAGEPVAAQVEAADLLSHVNINDWNEYSISARGNEIELSLNGHRTVHVTDNDPNGLDLSGLLALQLHSGPPMKIEFRNIRLKRFPLEDGRAKIVFIAGSASHGYYEHEHNAGCLLLAAHLNEAASEQGLPVTTAVYNNGWPKDPTALDNADCVVSYCDGGGGHYLNDRLDHFDWFVENQHVGLVCIHYAVEVPAGPSGENFLKWIGGYFEPHWSVNPHWDASFDELPEHPITNGVEPFTINDEWYYHMRFPESMEGVTPILTDLPPRETLNREDGPHSGNPYVREAVLQRMEPQHVAWAFERPDGRGRGFGFTGGHFHRNWRDDNFRKLVLNAICWAAQLEVPADGVTTHTPTQEEMDANQDEQPPGNAGVQQVPETVSVALDDEKSAMPAFSSDVVTSETPGHVIDVEADITGADKLYLVVTDGGNGFGCDWADWAEPMLVSEVAERRVRVVNGVEEGYDAVNETLLPLTTLDWTAASSEWGQVRKNANAEGGTLRIDGQRVADGIGTHANSIIEFDLPEGHTFVRFEARAGLDNGGTNQQGGGATSVQFHVFTERPSRQWLASMTSGSGGSPEGSHEAGDAIDQLEVHPDLEATLFAAEPMMLNPTDIDIDHLGRVWVCEVVNYRRFANSDHPERTEGDRILILEDTDHDGVADKSTVFYQGRDVDSAHGICVLPTIDGKGTKAIISCGDSVFFLIDDDGDLQADRKELLFTGIDGTQHDHGIHAFVFGPDGKLYFNFGNAGRRICDKDGNPIVDRAGNEVNDSRQPYQEGMVFRCNMDGSEFETLAWNFRNNWEVAVDSFGTMWQSDNDDDGNRGVRINYVMEFGNFGYRDEITGAGWNEPRTGWEEEIPLRHWHQNDPGVVPNLLQTGAGSPTGICVYEGSLLPQVFQGEVIHTDAGPNICRAYPVEVDGAGYTAEIVNILDGMQNQWFRPSDVCTAPDGSLIVADWYDPGVGGHRMQDVIHGRLFRVTPAGSESTGHYASAELDLSTPEGAIEALKSPNLATRYLGWTALYDMGAEAAPALRAVFQQDDNPVFRARSLWLLGKLKHQNVNTLTDVIAGLQDEDANIRVTAIRLARQLIHEGAIRFADVEGRVQLDDSSPAVRRELVIGIRDLRGIIPAGDCAEAWAELALQHDGEDRWYLEALGIAADGHWDGVLRPYDSRISNGFAANKSARDIAWRSRGAATPQLLADIISNGQTPAEELPRFYRAFDFLADSEQKRSALIQLAAARHGNLERQAFINSEAFARLGGVDLSANAELAAALESVLDATRGTGQFVDLVNRFNVADRYPELLAMATDHADIQLAVDALRVLLDRGQLELISEGLHAEDPEAVERLFTTIGAAADGRTVEMLQNILADPSQDVAHRRAAIRALGSARQGAEKLLAMAERNDYDPALKDALSATLHSVEWDDIKGPALAIFPLPETQSLEPIPPLAELIERSGDAANGRLLFHSTATCHKCHQVNGIGQIIGPDLSEIGRKLTRQAMYESVLFPSAGISHNFETWAVATTDGNIVTGLLMSETADAIDIKNEKGVTTTIAIDDIEERRKLDVSLMPADLMKLMTVNDLVDIVEYMTTLQVREDATQ